MCWRCSALSVSLLLSACAGPADPVYGAGETETKAEVLKIIPLGSAVDFAKTEMEARGFDCSMYYNQSHAVRDPDQPNHMVSSAPGDFLSCGADRPGDGVGALVLITKNYRIVFETSSSVVTAVDPFIYGTGL